MGVLALGQVLTMFEMLRKDISDDVGNYLDKCATITGQ